MLGHALAIEACETPQGVPVCNSLTQFPIVPVLHAHERKRTKDLLSSQSASSGIGSLETTLEIAPNFFDELWMCVNEVGDRPQDRIELDTLPYELEIGKANLGIDHACHFLAL